MEYTFTTEYTAKSLAVGAKALKKTLRSKKHRRSMIIGLMVIALGIWQQIPKQGEKYVLTFGKGITLLAVMVLIITLLFEDKINGWIGYKRMVQGMSPATCTFTEENYISATAIGTTIFKYASIKAVVENKEYFVFIMDNRHVQLYDKSTVTGGAPEQFARFITGKTGLPVTKI